MGDVDVAIEIERDPTETKVRAKEKIDEIGDAG